jgi:hypothetical protein
MVPIFDGTRADRRADPHAHAVGPDEGKGERFPLARACLIESVSR